MGGGEGELSDVEEGDRERDGEGLEGGEDLSAMEGYAYDASDSVLLSMQVRDLFGSGVYCTSTVFAISDV